MGGVLGRCFRVGARDVAPQHRLIFGMADGGQIEEHVEAEPGVLVGWLPPVDVPRRVVQALDLVFGGKANQVGQVVVDRARDDVEEEPLSRLRLLVHKQRQAVGRRVAQPFLGRQAIAPGLRDLLAVLVEEQLIGKSGRRRTAEDAANAPRKAHRIDQVLARHLIVDAQRHPPHGPVGLPLQLALAAGDRGSRPGARHHLHR